MNRHTHTHTHTHTQILLSHKKEWNNSIYSNVDESRDYHTKQSKSERQIPYDIIYIESKLWQKWI